MLITAVQVHPLSRVKSCVGIASVIFNHSLIVKDIRLIQPSTRRLLAMPSRKHAVPCPSCGAKACFHDTKFCPQCGAPFSYVSVPGAPVHLDIVHPLTPAMRAAMHEAIWQEFDRHGKLVDHEGASDSVLDEVKAQSF